MMKQLNLKARRAKVVTKLVQNRTLIQCLSVVFVVAGMAAFAQAGGPAGGGTGYTLTDAASSASVNLPGIPGGDALGQVPAGMYQLERNTGGSTDHINDMVQQWYWVSVNGGPGMPIQDLGNGQINHQSDRRLFFSYGNDDVSVRVRYTLEGSVDGAFANTVSRGVTVQNTSGESMDIRLYSFSNLAMTQILNGVISDDGFHPQVDEKARTVGIDRVRQWDVWTAQNPPTLISNSETVVNEPYDRVSVMGNVDALKDMIRQGLPLNNRQAVDLPGIQTGEEIAFAFEWDRTLGPGVAGAFSITEALSIVPEPATFAMLAAGALMLCRRRQTTR
jgi:hypothetical protein